MAKFRFLFALAVLAVVGLAAAVFARRNLAVPAQATDDSFYGITRKRDLLALMMAYPEDISGLTKGPGDAVYVVMLSGKKIIYDDGKPKSYDQKLAAADLQDMLEQVYPLDDIKTLLENNVDPGRIRDYGFFREVYGHSQSEVEKQLTRVPLGSGNYPFSKSNHAAKALRGVFEELSGCYQSEPELYHFVYPLGGTFNYRCIAGTNQLSPHAFGIAIDLHSDKSDYWRWATKQQGQKRLDSYPRKLVQVFEKHYFIWGGKWAHFDFLHFEYRPELIIKAKYFVEPETLSASWHEGYPDTPLIRTYVQLIDQMLDS